MRNAIVVLHRWIALILGLFIALVSITGSIIVVEGPLDRLLHPDLFTVPIPASGTARVTLDSLMASAGTRGAVTRLVLAEADGRSVLAQLTRGAGEVFLNPYTGAVIGQRTLAERNAGFTARNHSLHVTLMARAAGNQVVVWSTIAALFLVVGGLYLWWQDKIWRVRFAASWKRINFDLHHALGLFTFIVLFLMTATGVTMHYPIFGRFFSRLDRGAPAAPAPAPQSLPAPGAAMVSLEAAAGASQAALPGSELGSIGVPADTARPISIGRRFPEDRSDGGRSRIFVDRWTGRVLHVSSSRDARLGARLNAAQRPLHTGEILGPPTEVIWFVASLVLAAQAVTGTLMWWHGRPARKAEAARTARERSAAA